MAGAYNSDICKQLEAKVQGLNLHRPVRVTRYEPGTELTYAVRSVSTESEALMTVQVERFVGGGFAGQVYRVQVTDLTSEIPGLDVGGTYAIKILIPPSNFSRVFRDNLYWVGFQGPFQLQVNPAAARAGALWQTFIRRAAKIRFGAEDCVVNMHATFVDETLGSCGEISDWVEGRTWLLEVDERMDLLRRWNRGCLVKESLLGSPEYRAKKKFMQDFVALLHEMGAHEFARQYEWSTCKSQPNCLKKKGFDDDPSAGLTAVDFRAGLVLLPFLPMSPGDFRLIAKGLGRGSWVQFDRGNLDTLKKYVDSHREHFTDLRPLLKELAVCEKIYRDSLPDITHNFGRILSPKLWSSIVNNTIVGWRVRNRIDDTQEERFQASRIKAGLFTSLGVIAGLGRVLSLVALVGLVYWMIKRLATETPLSGQLALIMGGGLIAGLILSRGVSLLRLCWGRHDWRKHYCSLFNVDYLKRALRGHMAERVTAWHRDGRVSDLHAEKVANCPGRFVVHRLAAFIPMAGVHRILLDPAYAKERLHYLFVRPFKLYFDADFREQWMRDMITEGQRKHILSDEDAKTILGQLKEPYIQKYLVSLVVHLMTLPVTQIVSVIVAWVFYITHPDMEPTAKAAAVAGILVLFQVVPISPGSFCRGLYVVYRVIKDRDFKNYNIAVFLGFFKYVGYLAFPIQMTYRYPAMARFMAGHWATEAVHVVPVFGEGGALLEHAVFGWFYNWPLTLRRRINKRCEQRALLPSRLWHMPLLVLLGTLAFALTEWAVARQTGVLPSLKDIWVAALVIPFALGGFTTLLAAGAALGKRIVAAALGGLLLGSLYTVATFYVAGSLELEPTGMMAVWIWRFFTGAVFAAIGALLTELLWPESGDDDNLIQPPRESS